MIQAIFARRNNNGTPYASIICSCLGIVPLLVLIANKNIAGQVAAVIDFSVTSFLFIYLLCGIINLVLAWRNRSNFLFVINSLISIVFCIWVISEISFNTIMISSLFTLSGIPLYFFWYRRQTINGV